MPTPRSFLSLQSYLRMVFLVSGVVFMAMAGALRADEIPCAELISTAELRAASGIGLSRKQVRSIAQVAGSAKQ